MKFLVAAELPWRASLLLTLLLVDHVSTEVVIQGTSTDPVPTLQSARVVQHTPVFREKREIPTFEQDNNVDWYQFPEKMTFVIQALGHATVLNLTMNTYASSNAQLTNSHSFLKDKFGYRFGTYYSEESGASVLVECHNGMCSLHGSLEIDGKLYHIEQDYTSKDFTAHNIRERSVPTMEEIKSVMYQVTPEGGMPTSIEPTVTKSLVRRRRSVPDCDIIEMKVLADDTIWDEYMTRFGGDATKAEDEINKYFASVFAEVDLRLKCLTGYLEGIPGCASNCLRAILVDVEISKTSSWTDGNLLCQSFPDGKHTCFVKGVNGLNKCGYLNTQMTNHATAWDMLMCFTRKNIILQENGQWLDYFRTVSWRPSMCNGNKRYRTAISEAKGDGVDIQAAHSILHALGAYNDEERNCGKNDFYLMREHMSKKTYNPAHWGQNWYLSGCMANDICNYIKGLNNANTNCMRVQGSFDASKWQDWVETPYPGEIYSADEQCKERWGNDSVQCDPTGEGNLFPEYMCSRYIWCTRNGSCVCQTRVSSGTPCGKAKICSKGNCIPTPDVPNGGTCDCHSQCADDNAVCDPDTCTCECGEGYYNIDDGNCTMKEPTPGPCIVDIGCLDPVAICDNGTCLCPDCYVLVNGSCVEQSCLGEPCSSDDLCKGPNTICDPVNDICICDDGYVVNGEGECDIVNGSSCDLCPDDLVGVDGTCYGTRVGENCTLVTDTCIDDNAECNGTLCVCVAGFTWNGSLCVGNDLCDPCDPSVSTCECSDTTYRCVCPDGTVQIDDDCYGTRVNDPCTPALDTCIDDNAGCNGAICECLTGYTWNGSICEGTELCDPCDPSTVACQSPFVCGPSSQVCECPANRVQLGGSCFGTRVTEPCAVDIDTCIDDNAACNGTVCECLAGYNWNGSLCVGSDLCDPCDDSSCTSPLVCSGDTGVCSCPPDQVQIEDSCYGTDVGDPCTSTLDTCVDDNAFCNGSYCSCVANFVWNGSICVGQDLCDPCDPATPTCTRVCNPVTYRCSCESDAVEIDNACYGTRVGEFCTSALDTCVDDNAECNGIICDCLTGYVWNGSICVGPDICDPCDPDTASCGTGLICNSDTNLCSCPSDRVQIGDQCYGRTVNEVCTPSLDTCVDDNAECDGESGLCSCILGFIWTGDKCVGPDLCDPCDPLVVSCAGDLVCNDVTLRCDCQSGYVQIGDSCFGRFVNEPCSPIIDTCIDDNAACGGEVCACLPGYIWNGSLCVGPDLCDPCDPDTTSCDSSLICDLDTNTCSCPTNQVQIENGCYGTLVGEPCTPSLDTCVDDNAGCNGAVCACLPGYTWNGSLCVGTDLCDPCDPLDDTCNTGLVCGVDSNQCECPAGEVQIADMCYGTLVGEPCTSSLDTCVDDNAGCNGVFCACLAGYIWNGSLCVGPDLCDPCDPDTPSCDPSLICNPDTNQCGCPLGLVQIGDDCYGTLVGEPCTSSLDTCVDDNAGCNGAFCACLPGYIWNGSLCVGSQLCDQCDSDTLPCDFGLVCDTDTNTCRCPPDHVQIGDSCYGTLVSDPCTVLLDTCVDDNAFCNGVFCSCLPGYFWNGSVCVGSDLCEPCDPSINSCGAGLVCSFDTYTCSCPPDEVQIGNECYGTRVGEPCTPTLDTCVDDNAYCMFFLCFCDQGWLWNGTTCVGPDLCDPCDPLAPSCHPSLVCNPSTYRCSCPPDEVEIDHDCYGTHVGDTCTTSLDTCIDDNAYCSGVTCECLPGFVWNGTLCVGPDLCDPCDPSTPSCGTTLVCSTESLRCECPTDRVQIGDICVGTRVTEPCTSSLDTCVDDNAGCNGVVCECLAGYTWNGSLCVGSDLCDPCDTATPSCNSPLVCNDETGVCECPAGFVQIGGACYGRLVSEACTPSLDTCIDDNAECNGGVCDCIPGFIWNGSLCVGSELCEPCDPGTASCDSSLVCSPDTQRCECPSHQVQIDGDCYGRLVNEPCTSSLDTCIDDNAICDGTFCVCISGFVWNGSICGGPDLCDPCDPATPSCDSSLVCNPDTDRCECPADRVQIGDACYGRRINEPCNAALDTCIDDNAGCNGSVCECDPGLSWNGIICFGPGISNPCLNDSDCTPPFLCSDGGVCVCPVDLVQIGDSCYGRLVGESCTPSLDTCIDDNAECNGNICECLAGYTWNGSICVGTELCDPCDPTDNTCVTGLVCDLDTNRCQCPSDEVQVGEQCVGTDVNDPCTPSIDTCIDDNAACNGVICECVSGFSWNGSICVGTDLCEPCDPDSSTCDSSLVCSSNSYRCECPPDRVQIGEICYGTRVTEPCTSSLDTCVDDNAGCNGAVCACLPGFLWDGTRCVGTDLCDPCNPLSDTCSSPAVCEPTLEVCVCPSDMVQVEDACYGTIVGDACTTSLDTCIDDNAACDGTVCACIAPFTWNGSLCVGQDICDPCEPGGGSTCGPGLECNPDSNTCQCPPSEVEIEGSCYGTRVTEDCTTVLDTCIDDNAGCNGAVCACLAGYTWNGSLCVGTGLCDNCDAGVSPCDSGLVCSPDTNTCQCGPNLVQIEDMCYGTRVNDPCTSAVDTCIDDNAGCNGVTCQCLTGYTWNGSICVGEDLCDPCDPDTLSCDSSLVCSTDTFRCECPPDQVQIGDDCYGTEIGEPCTTALDTCVDDNAMCSGTVCVCMAGYIWNGSLCVGSELCDTCDPGAGCSSGLVCSTDTLRCECPPSEVQIGDMCFGTRVNEQCSSVLDTCIDRFADCNGVICACISGYTWNGSICVGEDLCDPCDPDTLSCDSSLVCSTDTFRCECPADEVQIGDACYGTDVGDNCIPSTDTCVDDNAECSGSVCECITGFVWNGSICVGPHLCDPCDPGTPSCDSDLVCSGDRYRCECPPGEVQIGDACYGRHIGDSCTTTTDTCIDDNAACNGATCECLPGFTWNGSLCLGPDLCDPCDLSTPSCDSSLVCNPLTNLCGCPTSAPIQIGDQCYGTFVGDPCTTSLDTCVDDNAGCNGAVCACLAGYTWNGSLCVGSDLCDPCDQSAQACSSDLVCSGDTSRCECPPGSVQIGDGCYGTDVGDSCTTTLDTCIDDNAGCNGAVCECLAGYTWNGSICVGSELCAPCDTSSQACDSGLECNPDTDTCLCPANRVQIDGSCYGTRVTEPCTSALDTCIDDNAGCNGAICQCLTGYTWNGSICVGSALCDPCDPGTLSCNTGLVCNADTNTCSCPTDEVQIDDGCYGTLIGEGCTSSLDTCIDDNAGCNGLFCECNPGFVWNGSLCVGPDLCDPCDPSTPSCDTSLVCDTDTLRCSCPSNRVQVENGCFGTLVGEPCTTSLDTCVDDNAGCNGAVCECLAGYTWNGSLCVGTSLCDPCDPSSDTCASGLACDDASGVCACPSGEVQIDDMCYGTHVGEQCTSSLDTCVDDFAVCDGTVCVCQSGFTWNGSVCHGTEICEPCDPTDSTCASELTCINDICQCPSDRVQIDGACYGTRFSEPCTGSLNTCIDDLADCIGGTCQCIPPYIYSPILDACVGPGLDDPCDDLSCGSGLVCINNVCECDDPLPVQIDNICYGTEWNEPCTTAVDTCIDDYAACDGSVCECVPGFVWNGLICVGSELDDPCDGSPASCASNGLVCGSTDRCECPSGEVQFDNMCYGLICGPCESDADCLGINQTCVNSACECVDGNYLDNCGICQSKIPDGDACESDEQCVSGICACDVCVDSLDDDCCEDCDDIRADITIITDNSDSSSSTYDKVTNFAIALANGFSVGPDEVRIGLVDYDSGVNNGNSYNIGSLPNNFDITSSLLSNNNDDGTRRTHLALDRANAYYGSAANRAGVSNFVIVILTGDSCCEASLIASANTLKANADMTVYAVGIDGQVSQADLDIIATDSSNTFLFANDAALDSIIADILDNSCVDVDRRK